MSVVATMAQTGSWTQSLTPAAPESTMLQQPIRKVIPAIGKQPAGRVAALRTVHACVRGVVAYLVKVLHGAHQMLQLD